ncbi:MAG: hypothetical protein VW378_05405, partial [bacterium]
MGLAAGIRSISFRRHNRDTSRKASNQTCKDIGEKLKTWVSQGKSAKFVHQQATKAKFKETAEDVFTNDGPNTDAETATAKEILKGLGSDKILGPLPLSGENKREFEVLAGMINFVEKVEEGSYLGEEMEQQLESFRLQIDLMLLEQLETKKKPNEIDRVRLNVILYALNRLKKTVSDDKDVLDIMTHNERLYQYREGSDKELKSMLIAKKKNEQLLSGEETAEVLKKFQQQHKGNFEMIIKMQGCITVTDDHGNDVKYTFPAFAGLAATTKETASGQHNPLAAAEAAKVIQNVYQKKVARTLASKKVEVKTKAEEKKQAFQRFFTEKTGGFDYNSLSESNRTKSNVVQQDAGKLKDDAEDLNATFDTDVNAAQTVQELEAALETLDQGLEGIKGEFEDHLGDIKQYLETEQRRLDQEGKDLDGECDQLQTEIRGGAVGITQQEVEGLGNEIDGIKQAINKLELDRKKYMGSKDIGYVKKGEDLKQNRITLDGLKTRLNDVRTKHDTLQAARLATQQELSNLQDKFKQMGTQLLETHAYKKHRKSKEEQTDDENDPLIGGTCDLETNLGTRIRNLQAALSQDWKAEHEAEKESVKLDMAFFQKNIATIEHNQVTKSDEKSEEIKEQKSEIERTNATVTAKVTDLNLRLQQAKEQITEDAHDPDLIAGFQAKIEGLTQEVKGISESAAQCHTEMKESCEQYESRIGSNVYERNEGLFKQEQDELGDGMNTYQAELNRIQGDCETLVAQLKYTTLKREVETLLEKVGGETRGALIQARFGEGEIPKEYSNQNQTNLTGLKDDIKTFSTYVSSRKAEGPTQKEGPTKKASPVPTHSSKPISVPAKLPKASDPAETPQRAAATPFSVPARLPKASELADTPQPAVATTSLNKSRRRKRRELAEPPAKGDQTGTIQNTPDDLEGKIKEYESLKREVETLLEKVGEETRGALIEARFGEDEIPKGYSNQNQTSLAGLKEDVDKYLKETTAAAIKTQARARGKKAKEDFKAQKAAAIKIQAGYRSYTILKRFDTAKTKRTENAEKEGTDYTNLAAQLMIESAKSEFPESIHKFIPQDSDTQKQTLDKIQAKLEQTLSSSVESEIHPEGEINKTLELFEKLVTYLAESHGETGIEDSTDPFLGVDPETGEPFAVGQTEEIEEEQAEEVVDHSRYKNNAQERIAFFKELFKDSTGGFNYDRGSFDTGTEESRHIREELATELYKKGKQTIDEWEQYVAVFDASSLPQTQKRVDELKSEWRRSEEKLLSAFDSIKEIVATQEETLATQLSKAEKEKDKVVSQCHLLELQIKSKLEDIKGQKWVAGLEKRGHELLAMQKELKTKMNTAEQAYREYAADTQKGLCAKIDYNLQTFQPICIKIQKELKELEDNVAAYKTSIDSAEHEYQQLNALKKKLRQELDEVESELAQNWQILSQTTAYQRQYTSDGLLEKAVREQDKHNQDIGQLKQEIESLETVSSEDKRSKFQAGKDKLNEEINHNMTTIRTIQENEKTMRAIIEEEIRGESEAKGEAIGNLEETVSSLNTSLSQIRDRLAVIKDEDQGEDEVGRGKEIETQCQEYTKILEQKEAKLETLREAINTSIDSYSERVEYNVYIPHTDTFDQEQAELEASIEQTRDELDKISTRMTTTLQSMEETLIDIREKKQEKQENEHEKCIEQLTHKQATVQSQLETLESDIAKLKEWEQEGALAEQQDEGLEELKDAYENAEQMIELFQTTSIQEFAEQNFEITTVSQVCESKLTELQEQLVQKQKDVRIKTVQKLEEIIQHEEGNLETEGISDEALLQKGLKGLDKDIKELEGRIANIYQQKVNKSNQEYQTRNDSITENLSSLKVEIAELQQDAQIDAGIKQELQALSTDVQVLIEEVMSGSEAHRVNTNIEERVRNQESLSTIIGEVDAEIEAMDASHDEHMEEIQRRGIDQYLRLATLGKDAYQTLYEREKAKFDAEDMVVDEDLAEKIKECDSELVQDDNPGEQKENLDARKDLLKETIPMMQKAITTHQAATVLQQTKTSLREQLDKLKQTLAPLEQDTNLVTDHLTKSVETITENIEGLEQGQKESIQEELSALESGIEGAITTRETQIAGLKLAITTGIEQATEQLAALRDTFNEADTDLEARCTDLQQKGQQTTTLTEHQQLFEALTTLGSDIEAKLTEKTTALAALQQRLKTATQSQETLVALIAGTQDTQKGIEDHIKSFKHETRQKDFAQRYQAIQRDIQSIKTTLQTSKESCTQVMNKKGKTIEQRKKELQKMEQLVTKEEDAKLRQKIIELNTLKRECDTHSGLQSKYHEYERKNGEFLAEIDALALLEPSAEVGPAIQAETAALRSQVEALKEACTEALTNFEVEMSRKDSKEDVTLRSFEGKDRKNRATFEELKAEIQVQNEKITTQTQKTEELIRNQAIFFDHVGTLKQSYNTLKVGIKEKRGEIEGQVWAEAIVSKYEKLEQDIEERVSNLEQTERVFRQSSHSETNLLEKQQTVSEMKTSLNVMAKAAKESKREFVKIQKEKETQEYQDNQQKFQLKIRLIKAKAGDVGIDRIEEITGVDELIEVAQQALTGKDYQKAEEKLEDVERLIDVKIEEIELEREKTALSEEQDQLSPQGAQLIKECGENPRYQGMKQNLQETLEALQTASLDMDQQLTRETVQAVKTKIRQLKQEIENARPALESQRALLKLTGQSTESKALIGNLTGSNEAEIYNQIHTTEDCLKYAGACLETFNIPQANPRETTKKATSLLLKYLSINQRDDFNEAPPDIKRLARHPSIDLSQISRLNSLQKQLQGDVTFEEIQEIVKHFEDIQDESLEEKLKTAAKKDESIRAQGNLEGFAPHAGFVKAAKNLPALAAWLTLKTELLQDSDQTMGKNLETAKSTDTEIDTLLKEAVETFVTENSIGLPPDQIKAFRFMLDPANKDMIATYRQDNTIPLPDEPSSIDIGVPKDTRVDLQSIESQAKTIRQVREELDAQSSSIKAQLEATLAGAGFPIKAEDLLYLVQQDPNRPGLQQSLDVMFDKLDGEALMKTLFQLSCLQIQQQTIEESAVKQGARPDDALSTIQSGIRFVSSPPNIGELELANPQLASKEGLQKLMALFAHGLDPTYQKSQASLLSTTQLNVLGQMLKSMQENKTITVKLGAGEGKTFLSKLLFQLVAMPEEQAMPVIHVAPFDQHEEGWEELTSLDELTGMQGERHLWIRAETMERLVHDAGEEEIAMLQQSLLFMDEYDRFEGLGRTLDGLNVNRRVNMSATDKVLVAEQRLGVKIETLNLLTMNRQFPKEIQTKIQELNSYCNNPVNRSDKDKFRGMVHEQAQVLDQEITQALSKKNKKEVNKDLQWVQQKLRTLCDQIPNLNDSTVDQMDEEFNSRDLAMSSTTHTQSAEILQEMFGRAVEEKGSGKFQFIFQSSEFTATPTDSDHQLSLTEIQAFITEKGSPTPISVHMLAPAGLDGFIKGQQITLSSDGSIHEFDDSTSQEGTIEITLYDRTNRVGGDFGDKSNQVDYQEIHLDNPDIDKTLLYQMARRNRQGAGDRAPLNLCCSADVRAILNPDAESKVLTDEAKQALLEQTNENGRVQQQQFLVDRNRQKLKTKKQKLGTEIMRGTIDNLPNPKKEAIYRELQRQQLERGQTIPEGKDAQHALVQHWIRERLAAPDLGKDWGAERQAWSDEFQGHMADLVEAVKEQAEKALETPLTQGLSSKEKQTLRKALSSPEIEKTIEKYRQQSIAAGESTNKAAIQVVIEAKRSEITADLVRSLGLNNDLINRLLTEFMNER